MDQLARSLADLGLPHPLCVQAARAAIDAGDPDSARRRAESVRDVLLTPVINATGVLLHTNLGRAPLAVTSPAEYSNLELDLDGGSRGSRQAGVGHLLAAASGAEAALVVNNGAAAVLLVLAALAGDGQVAVSRGELVEIGGGFRVPDVMTQSGATLVEVGTTNRTALADYEAVADRVGLIMKVHRSNFSVTGFTSEVDVGTLAGLDPPLVVDLGSGLLDARCPWLKEGPPPWLAREPALRQTLDSGAALAIISGDKLFGGPQAGVIAGRADLVERCARHPLYRALRPGALVLGAVQDVALAYLGRTASQLPFWAMATVPVAALRRRAEAIGVGEVVECASLTGGGTLPGVEIPSIGLAFDGDLTDVLRAARPLPVVARVHDGATVLDLRTVAPEHDGVLAERLAELAGRS